jgi:macrolide-specific efflux system membrane fusion protein
MALDDEALVSRPRPERAPDTAKGPAPKAPPPKLSHGVRHWIGRHRRVAMGAGVVLALLIVVFVIVPAFHGSKSAHLELQAVASGNIEATVTAVGNLQPKDYVDVGAQVSGQIKTIPVAIGDKVKKGDLLVEIDAQVQQARAEADKDNLAALEANLVSQQAQLKLKKTQYDRHVRLNKANATSEDALQSAKAAYDSGVAQVAALKAQIKQAQSTLHADLVNLSYATIRAPMDGTVVSLPARVGQTLTSGFQTPTLMRIADLSTMEVWTQVSEADVGKLHPGMEAYFTTLGNPGKRYYGKVAQILPTPETVNNVILYDVLFYVPNDGSLMTQMTAQVFFITASAKNVLTVPVSALHPYRGPPEAAAAGDEGSAARPANGVAGANGGRAGGANGTVGLAAGPLESTPSPGSKAMVLVEPAGGGRPKPRVVEVGVSDRINAEIRSGLKVGEKVVVGSNQPNGAATQSRTNGRPRGFRMMGRF